MNENNDCVTLKRVCAFFLGVVIGLAAGYQYGVGQVRQNFNNRTIKQAEEPALPKYQKMQRERREKMLEEKKNVRPDGGKRERTPR
jgi:uncharacterized protein HemX